MSISKYIFGLTTERNQIGPNRVIFLHETMERVRFRLLFYFLIKKEYKFVSFYLILF